MGHPGGLGGLRARAPPRPAVTAGGEMAPSGAAAPPLRSARPGRRPLTRPSSPLGRGCPAGGGENGAGAASTLGSFVRPPEPRREGKAEPLRRRGKGGGCSSVAAPSMAVAGPRLCACGASGYEARKGLLVMSAGDLQQLVGKCVVCLVSAEAIQSTRTPKHFGDAGEVRPTVC